MDAAKAYAMGRNTVWNGEAAPANPFTGELARHWSDGRKDAKREVELDEDTEWDDD